MGVREKEVVGLVRALRREKDRRAMEAYGFFAFDFWKLGLGGHQRRGRKERVIW